MDLQPSGCVMLHRYDIFFHNKPCKHLMKFSGRKPILPFSPFSTGGRQMGWRKRRGTYLSTLTDLRVPFHFLGGSQMAVGQGKKKGRNGNGSSGLKGERRGTLSNTVCVSTVADYKVESYLLPTIDEILGSTTKVEGRAAPLHEEIVKIVS